MKAIDYYEKYNEEFEENPDVAVRNLRKEMMEEVESIKEIRHVKTQDGHDRVVREQNNKWNAIVNIFEKHGKSPIVRNDLVHEDGGGSVA